MESQLWPAARRVFIAALSLFVVTIVIGILNGLDVYLPDHDTLMAHVHAGTLGWITLSVSGVALLMFTGDRRLSEGEVKRASAMAWSMIAAIYLYVLGGFLAGGHIPGDRIQRPILGTLLFLVVIWYLVWLARNYRADGQNSVARLGLLLAWISLLIGAVLGVMLGIYTARGEIPGLSDKTASSFADAHPPAMVIGFLILAAMAIIEWSFRGDRSWTKAGATQMWLLFIAGIIVNVGFVSGQEEKLLGPANLLMIVGVVMLVVRSWEHLAPSGWRGAGSGTYPRMSSLFLVVYLILGTVLIGLVVSGNVDFDALTDGQEGLLLTFDHSMFVGVMTSLLLGVIASRTRGHDLATVDKVVLWGLYLGLVTFAVGLITVQAVPKRIGTPIMGTALLIGIGTYVTMLARKRDAGSLTAG
jgi:FtsH-binding integral membrane protein